MTTQPMTTKADLLHALRDNGSTALDRLRALPPEEFETGRYESGWNGRQILAHIASIEWTYPRLIDVAREASGLPVEKPAAAPKPAPKPGELPTRTAQGGILSYNDRQVEKRADMSVAELLDEFETNRAATIAAVEAADESLFGVEIRSAGGVTGPLSGVINAVAVLHVAAHVGDICGNK
jgi:hypothetical protein